MRHGWSLLCLQSLLNRLVCRLAVPPLLLLRFVESHGRILATTAGLPLLLRLGFEALLLGVDFATHCAALCLLHTLLLLLLLVLVLKSASIQ